MGAEPAAGGGGRGGGGGGVKSGKPASTNTPADQPAPTRASVDEVEGVGLVREIDLPANRITLSYEPIEVLNWPAGTLPFAISKDGLLKDVTVGEKVRFTLESHQISGIKPY